jgi:hypothetical protein
MQKGKVEKWKSGKVEKWKSEKVGLFYLTNFFTFSLF